MKFYRIPCSTLFFQITTIEIGFNFPIEKKKTLQRELKLYNLKWIKTLLSLVGLSGKIESLVDKNANVHETPKRLRFV